MEKREYNGHPHSLDESGIMSVLFVLSPLLQVHQYIFQIGVHSVQHRQLHDVVHDEDECSDLIAGSVMVIPDETLHDVSGHAVGPVIEQSVPH